MTRQGQNGHSEMQKWTFLEFDIGHNGISKQQGHETLAFRKIDMQH